MAVFIQRPAVQELPLIWNSAPGERSPDFFTTFSAISLATQRFLRARIAPVFLADPAIFEHPNLVYPMLMYAASRPFRPRSLHEFSYDPMDVAWFLRFVRASKRSLAPRLREVYDRLDREQIACSRAYGPRRVALAIRTVRRFKRSQTLLSGLVAGEAALVADLLRLEGLGRLSERDRKRRQARFFRNLHKHLRHMCLRCDLTPLAPVLIDVATEELTNAVCMRMAA
jgi:hypothetical protein